MKMKKSRINVAGFIAFSILCLGLNFSVPTTAQKITTAKSTPTPKQTPFVKPATSPTPTISPTATPTPLPTPTPAHYQTLAEVQTKIQSVLARSELQRGQVGIKINSLDTGKTLFEQNAEKYLMPASNMKSYTMAAAIERLSPDFKFVTSVYAAAPIDSSGTIKGDLTVYGRGDVSFSNTFYDGDNYKAVNGLAAAIAQAGVKRVEGNLVGDESFFSGSAIPDGWEWDDLQWKSGAEVSALPFDDNVVELKITPNTQLGMPCIIAISPPNSLFKVVNLSQTVSSGEKRMISVTKKLDSNELEINGTMPADDKGYTGNITVTKPAGLFVAQLKNALQQKGIVVTGQTRVMDYKDLMQTSRPLPARSKIVLLPLNDYVSPKEIVSFESPPLSVIAAKTLKPSQNMYTETILRALGEQYGRKQETSLTVDADALVQIGKMTSAEIGLQTVQRFLTEIGIPADSVIQHDGSGLSRHNLVTPSSAIQLYTYMSKSRYANVWRDALTVGAVDGTLRNRFKNTNAAGNVRGKTGTIDQVSALSGYVTTNAGERLVFSIIVNGVNNSRQREAAIDEIVVALANFSGKTF